MTSPVTIGMLAAGTLALTMTRVAPVAPAAAAPPSTPVSLASTTRSGVALFGAILQDDGSDSGDDGDDGGNDDDGGES